MGMPKHTQLAIPIYKQFIVKGHLQPLWICMSTSIFALSKNANTSSTSGTGEKVKLDGTKKHWEEMGKNIRIKIFIFTWDSTTLFRFFWTLFRILYKWIRARFPFF